MTKKRWDDEKVIKEVTNELEGIINIYSFEVTRRICNNHFAKILKTIKLEKLIKTKELELKQLKENKK